MRTTENQSYRRGLCGLLAALVLCAAAPFASAAGSTGGSWAQINTPQGRPGGWRQIVQDSAFQLGERQEAGEANGRPLYEAGYGSYPSIDGSTVAVPMALEFVRQHLGLSDEDAKSFVYFSTTHGAYEHLIYGRPNGSSALPSLDTVMDAAHPVDLVIGTEPSEAELALAAENGVTLVMEPVCLDAFVFITSVENPVDGLTLEDIRSIYAGHDMQWGDVYFDLRGTESKIVAYQREPNSGSQTAMENLVMQGIPMTSDSQVRIAYGMADLTSRIGEYENGQYSLGYTFKYYLDELQRNDQIKILKINGVAPTPETMRDRSYPLTVCYYGVIRAGDEDRPGGRFLDWMLGEEGQACIAQAGYVPMSEAPVNGKYVQWDEGDPDGEYYSWDGVIYRIYKDHAEFEAFNGDRIAILHEEVDGRPMTSDFVYADFEHTLEEVTLCEGIRSANFSDAYTLRKVTFSETVTTLVWYGFWFTNVEEIILPQSLTTIESEAFAGSKVKEVVIPEGVTVLEDSTFGDARHLERVALPSRLVSIGKCAFYETLLRNIEIPASVQFIADSAFYRCNELEAIHVDPANEVYYSLDGLLFRREDDTLLRFPPAKSDYYDVPPGTKRIAPSAFSYGDGLRSLSLPLGITELEAETFAECTALERIVLPMTLTRMGERVFSDCVSLLEIVIPEGITVIERSTFHNCAKLERVELPSTLERIEKYAFGACPSLKELRIPQSVGFIDETAFLGDYWADGENTVTLIVSQGSYAEQFAKEQGIAYRVE